ncbi:MAG TPA: hypothetical protein VKE94_07885 [Gemmataceae bacterium]|nr:hypothetical protein [Gemmataceae bacterium]
MAARFDDGGIRFQYPENWRLEREENDSGWTVSLQSPGTAFMMVCLREDLPTPDQVAEAALDALREEYPELEADDCVDNLAGQPAIGHDIRFISLDLTNTCWTRSFYSSEGTVLVLCQANDLELEVHEPVLRAICKSLEVDEE